MRKIFLLFLLGFSATLLFAQQVPTRIHFQHLTVADGLPENSVSCILQDHQGYMWLGTSNGIVRYDGTAMNSFQYNADNPFSFKGRYVRALLEDKNGDIWICSERLFRFERASQRFIEYPDKNTSLEKDYSYIESIYPDKAGNLWIIRNTDDLRILEKFDPRTNDWTYFSSDPKNTHYHAANYTQDLFIDDKTGQIWLIDIGTKSNILQFLDPKTDKFIAFSPHQSPALAEDFKNVLQVVSGKHSQLYLSSFGKGLFELNTETGMIKQFKHDAQDSSSLLNDTTLTLYKDKSGYIWISTPIGQEKYNPATNSFVHYVSRTGDLSTPGTYLRSPYETPDGDIWFQGSTGGMSFYHRKTNSFIRYEADEKQENDLWGPIQSSFVDPAGMVWFGSHLNGLNKEIRMAQFLLLNHIQGNLNSLQDATVYSIYEAPSQPGIIWFGTKTGLDRYNKKTGIFSHYTHDEHNENSLSKGAVRSIAEDTKGRLWVATFQGGLNLMDRINGRFVHFTHDTTNANSLGDNRIFILKAVSDGTLWIGCYEGLDHFDYKNNKFTHYQQTDTSYTPDLFNLISQYTTPDRRVAAIVHPANNVNITAGFNLAKSTDILVTGMGEINNFLNADWGWIEDDSGKIIWDMNFDNTRDDGNGGRMRTGVMHLPAGSYRLRYKSDRDYSYAHWWRAPPVHYDLWGIQVTKISSIESQVFNKEVLKRYFNGLRNSIVANITEDSRKNIWIGTQGGGVTKFDPATGQFNSYRDKFKGPLHVIGSIVEDKTGKFWMGDFFFGLLLVNKNGEIIKRYNASNGLPGNTVEGIQQDAKGILWISTDNGLCRFDPATEKFLWYNKNNGLQGLVFHYNSLCQTADGEMYFGGINGVNSFYPDQIKLDTVPPPVIFTDLDIAGKPATLGHNGQLPVHISVAKDIRLPYNQNDLTFHFTSILFNRGNESRFAYRLSPNDKDWIQAGALRQVRFTDLSPGTYVLSIKSTNGDGVWNEQGTSITIDILPPWWRTWWAYLIYVLALLGGFIGFIRYRSAALKKENKILEDKVEIRTTQLQTSIEDLKATQSQLIQSEKMASLGELTAGIAHEIQNPLNFVNNFSEVNKELIDETSQAVKAGNSGEAIELLSTLKNNEEKINHHGKRADAIVKGMLQHSRSSTGVKEPTDINALADEYLRLAYHGLRAKDNTFNAALQTDFDATIRKMNVIPQEIGRVLLNLYYNAFYAVIEKKKSAETGYEPTVSVSIKRIRDKVEIRVKDNGNGIPKKVVDKIFQPFFTTKPTGQGTGLGLSLSYDIVKAHGGEIKVESKEGEGSEFIISVPLK